MSASKQQECPLCLFVDAVENKTLACYIEQADGEHNLMPYRAIKITAGGDQQKCEDLISIVMSYVHGVLGVPEQFNSSGKAAPKPS
jgi:hypothetical protein